jgi:hypothetical protein
MYIIYSCEYIYVNTHKQTHTHIQATLRGKIAALQGMTPAVRKRKEDREILTLWKQLRDLKAIEVSLLDLN